MLFGVTLRSRVKWTVGCSPKCGPAQTRRRLRSAGLAALRWCGSFPPSATQLCLTPVLAALPASRRGSPWQLQPTAVLAIEGNKACGIRQISGRAHDHRSWHGPTVLAEAGAWLETFARRREEHVALVIEEPAAESESCRLASKTMDPRNAPGVDQQGSPPCLSR